MAKERVYWDSCAWLGLLNGEENRKRALEFVYELARSGGLEIWTSTVTLVEVNRYQTEFGQPKPLSADNLRVIEAFFSQPFIKLVPLDAKLASDARRLVRETPKLSKKWDAAHLASALFWSVSTLHTYDGSDLLHLNSQLTCRNGDVLNICLPEETADGPLFANSQ